MNLKQLLAAINTIDTHGDTAIEINKIEFDSRKITTGDLFVAIKGVQVDGHKFIEKAVNNGAKAILYQESPDQFLDGITYLKVQNSPDSLGRLASTFFGHPSRSLQLVGITGTNGKTTIATLLFDLFSELGYKCGLLSTNVNRIGTEILTTKYTTPDAITLNDLLSKMVEAGCDYAFMEVSSHAVHQRRIAGLHFTGGVFTNMSHDHLLYHKTFDAYIKAKKAFFDELPAVAFALVNIDDKRGTVMVQNTKAKVYTYSLKRVADFKGKVLENSISGLYLEMNGTSIFSQLVGHYNAYNLLAVYGTSMLLEADAYEVLTKLSSLQAPEGRFQSIVGPESKITAIVDYAHTPDALENVLKTIAQVRNSTARVITVVGCGGDRDREKRPTMAKVACDWSNQVILTSDNPRSEDPHSIIEEMEKGIPAVAVRKVLSITDRREAIRTACRIANAGDIILVAGKGHEKYQEIDGVRFPFDDREILENELL